MQAAETGVIRFVRYSGTASKLYSIRSQSKANETHTEEELGTVRTDCHVQDSATALCRHTPAKLTL